MPIRAFAVCLLLTAYTSAQGGDPSTVAQRTNEPKQYSDFQAYATAIRSQLRAHHIILPYVPDTATAVFELTLSDAGTVIELKPATTNRFPSYDQAIQRAIFRAQPFPLLVRATTPSKPVPLKLNFRVKE